MNIGVIGRTRILLESAKKLISEGFNIPFIYTCKAEPFYQCDENEFRQFAKQINADFFNDLQINTNERVNLLKKYHCDLAISMNWLTILNKQVCDAFKYGIWNAHPGDLPRYRGNACPNWAILNNEQSVGLSIHEMIPGEVDSGDIILKVFFPLSLDTYIQDVYYWMAEQIPSLFVTGIQKLLQGTLKKGEQSRNPCDILRCFPRKPEDSRIFWDQGVDSIYNLIRASSRPFSGAFCYLENELIKIWRAKKVIQTNEICAIPGQVLYIMNGDPIIACNKGILQLTEVEFASNNKNAKDAISRSLRNRLS